MNAIRQRMARVGAPLRVCLSACVYEPDSERRRLRRMLDSTVAAGTTDYAIAVDRKSTPGTVWWVRWHLFRRRGLIASLLRPARVVEFQWRDDFAHARNVALDLVPAECEWWYAIDADDVLQLPGGKSLPEVLAGVPDGTSVILIAYEVPDRLGALLERMSYETFFRGPITYRWRRAWGEVLDPLDRGRSFFSDAVVRRHDQDSTLPRGERNPRVMDKALADDPNDLGMLIFRAQAHGHRWEWAEALSCLERAMTLSERPRQAYGVAIHSNDVLVILGRLDDALAMCRKAADIRPEFPEAHIKAAGVLYLLGRFDEAVIEAQAGIDRLSVFRHFGERQHTGAGGNPVLLYEADPFLTLAQAQAQLGDFEGALANAERVFAAEPPLAYLLALNQLCAYAERNECPPFAATWAERMSATRALVERIREYETVEALLRDADRIAVEVEADGAVPDMVLAFIGRRFEQRGEAWGLPREGRAERLPTVGGAGQKVTTQKGVSAGPASPETYFCIGMAMVGMYRLADAEAPMRGVLRALDARSPAHRPLWPTVDQVMRHMAHAVLADVAAAKGDYAGAKDHADRGLPQELPGCWCDLRRLREELDAIARGAAA